jgi:hypothetical protein
MVAVLAAVPALAAENGPPRNLFTMQDARNHLMHLGYTNVSELAKDASGKWIGSAVKDGKTVPVAVVVKPTH